MSRPTTNQLLLLAEGLSPRQKQIVEAVATHRFVRGDQLHRLFFDGLTRRMSRKEFAAMTTANLLVTLKRQIGGVRAGSRGHIFALGATGRRLASFLGGEGLSALVSRYEPGEAFVDHSLAISELYVQLVEANRDSRFDLLDFQAEPACWRNHTASMGRLATLKPDARLTIGREDFEELWWIEVDRGTVGRGSLARKHRDYLAYRQTGREQQAEGVFPRVLWIVPDQKRAQVVAEVAEGFDSAGLFRVTTDDHAVAFLSGRGEEAS